MFNDSKYDSFTWHEKIQPHHIFSIEVVIRTTQIHDVMPTNEWWYFPFKTNVMGSQNEVPLNDKSHNKLQSTFKKIDYTYF